MSATIQTTLYGKSLRLGENLGSNSKRRRKCWRGMDMCMVASLNLLREGRLKTYGQPWMIDLLCFHNGTLESLSSIAIDLPYPVPEISRPYPARCILHFRQDLRNRTQPRQVSYRRSASLLLLSHIQLCQRTACLLVIKLQNSSFLIQPHDLLSFSPSLTPKQFPSQHLKSTNLKSSHLQLF